MSLAQRINNAVAARVAPKRARTRPGRALASITFDDFPKSAWTVAGPMLRRRGVRATYYVAGGFCGRTEDGLEYFDADDLRALAAAGHEVGCHSFSHEMAPTVSSERLLEEAERNAAFVRQVIGDRPLTSYAYPYGEVSPRTKGLFARRFANARGIRSGINAGTIDLALLRAIPLESRRWRPDEIDQAIDAAHAAGGWVIFFTHDVSDDPSPFGCTPAMLGHVLDKLAERRIETLPVANALARAVHA